MRNKVIEALKSIVYSIIAVLVLFVIFIGVLFLRGIPAQAAELNGYEAIFASASEADYAALENVIYHESAIADCDFTVNVAVAETVLNRVLQGGWGKSIYEVCTAKGQFCYRKMSGVPDEHVSEDISDAIEYLANGGSGFLPSKEYIYFATKKQSYAKNHVWIGAYKNGKPKKGKGMFFGEEK